MQNSLTMSKKTIYLIRHGQTDFNKQGSSDDVIADRLAAIAAMRKK